MRKGQYTITLDHENGWVVMSAYGEITRDLGDELITQAREKAAEYHYNIICDVRKSKARVTLADWYFLPRRLAVYKNIKTRNIKTAIIINEGGQEKTYRFFETVTRNLGLNIRVFLREADAQAWLGANIPTQASQ